jgi:hypothetical protein
MNERERHDLRLGYFGDKEPLLFIQDIIILGQIPRRKDLPLSASNATGGYLFHRILFFIAIRHRNPISIENRPDLALGQ